MTVPTLEEWRHDEWLLDFHAQWHANFPWYVRWNNPGQGEEFLYFHRQSLARYIAERTARGGGMLPNWSVDEPIPEAHTNVNGVSRPANWYIPGSSQSDFRLPSWFTEAGGQAQYDDPRSNAHPQGMTGLADFPDVDTLGKALEHPFHNVGHGTMGALFDAPGGNGDMARVGTAPRDPFFFLWHRLIDNVWRTWSELPNTQLPNVDALPVEVRDGHAKNGTDSPDIIVSRTRVADPATAFAEQVAAPQSDDVFYGDTAYLYVRVRNTSDQPVNARVHFFCAPVALAQNRRYWIEIPQTNAGNWGTPISLEPNEFQVVRSGSMPGAIVWNAEFIPAPNSYRVLAAVVPEDAPRGYPFDRGLPPNGSVETIVKNNSWVAWRDTVILEQQVLDFDADRFREIVTFLNEIGPWPPRGPFPVPQPPWPPRPGPRPDPVPWPEQ